MNTIFSKFSLLLLVIFAGNTFSAMSVAGEKVNKTLLVDATGSVFVEIPRGFVKIQGWQKDQVLIQGELDDSIDKLIFKTKENKTLIKLDTQGQEHWGDASVLNIFMPQQSQLRFKGIDTSFSITQLKNNIEGKSINGDLVVNNAHGKILLSAVSGDVAIIDSSGLIKVKSVSGALDYSGEFEQAYLKSMSGDITADISGTNQLTIKNISGDTLINGQVKKQGQLNLTSVSGNIVYQVTGDLNAECELVSQFGGEIKNQLTDDLPSEGNLNKKALSFVSGDGSAKLTMNTITGSVSIVKTKD